MASRPTARQRGYTSAWDKARKAFLTAHPLCAECAKRGVQTPASHVDHITPHKGDKALFWNRANWQPLCPTCHNSGKQRAERGRPIVAIGADGWPIDGQDAT